MCYIPLMRDADDRESNVQIETGSVGELSLFPFLIIKITLQRENQNQNKPHKNSKQRNNKIRRKS